MKDPYEVLGVSRNASEEEIKAKYKELVKKYHPDRYQDNPLASLAEEKLQEINEAYDYIQKNHGAGQTGGGSYGSSGYSGGSSYGSSAELAQARQMIQTGNIYGAESLLNSCADRSAEWYYLMGMVSYRKGWFDDASQKIQTAVSMDPGNMEYRQAMNAMMGSGGAYRNAAYGRGYQSNSDLACGLCNACLCAECLCGGGC